MYCLGCFGVCDWLFCGLLVSLGGCCGGFGAVFRLACLFACLVWFCVWFVCLLVRYAADFRVLGGCMLVVVCLVWLLLVLGWSAFVLTWFYWWFSRLLFDWGGCCLG